MIRLTDTHALLLSAAAGRTDGIIPITDRLTGSVARAVAMGLINLGYADERSVQPPARGWRENDEGHQRALVITAQGLAAIGIMDGVEQDLPSHACKVDAASSPANDRPRPASQRRPVTLLLLPPVLAVPTARRRR